MQSGCWNTKGIIMTSSEISRREFIQTSAVTATGVTGALTATETALSAESIDPVKLDSGEKLRLAIIGCGARSQNHIVGINHYKNLEIVAICDILPEMLEEKGKLIERGAPRRYTDYQKMLQQDDIHAVVNILPNTLHCEMTVASLDAGKHVLCEKPLANNVTECRQMMKAADRNRRVLQVGTQSRHNPGFQNLVRQLREGLVGKPLYGWVHSFRADWRKLDPDPVKDAEINWRMQMDECGGITYEMGIHLIDVFNWFIGSAPVEVTSMGGINNTKLEKRDSWDHAGVITRYENGAVVNYGANLYSCGGPGPDCIFGDGGSLTCEPTYWKEGPVKVTKYNRSYWRPFGMKEDPEYDVTPLSLPDAPEQPTTLQYDHFYQACLGQKPPFPSAGEHLKAVQIARGSILSTLERRHIRISEVD
jgi:predicted dehydrogenase